jgi:hypothetical protein
MGEGGQRLCSGVALDGVEEVTWVIAGILAVDLVIVLCFASVELLARYRVRREIEKLDSLWHSPARMPVPAVHAVGALRVRTRPIVRRAASSRLPRIASLGAAVAAVAILVVVAALGGAPARRSLTVASGSSDASPREGATLEPAAEPALGADASSSGGRMLDDGSPAPPAPSTTSHGLGSVEIFAAVPSSSTSIVLVWDDVAAAIRYDIERRSVEDGAPDWSLIATTDGGVTTFTDSDLESATTYYYRVTALTEAGPASTSEVISATTPVPALEATSLIVAATSTTTIVLDWADVEDETGYRIERSLGGDPGWVSIATTGTDITEYTDTGLAPKTTYRYRIFAISEGDESPPSNIGVAKTPKEVGGVSEPPGQDEDGTSPGEGKGNDKGNSGDDAGSGGDTDTGDGTGSDDGMVWDDVTRLDETSPGDGTTT